jgi:hypothetical protein
MSLHTLNPKRTLKKKDPKGSKPINANQNEI